MSVCLHSSIALTLDTSTILIHIAGTDYSIQIIVCYTVIYIVYLMFSFDMVALFRTGF